LNGQSLDQVLLILDLFAVLHDGLFKAFSFLTLSFVLNECSLLIDCYSLLAASLFFFTGCTIWGGRMMLIAILRGATSQS
jgi:Na+-transporting NADH:ubiquinone oxidoreductase subunit NqrD